MDPALHFVCTKIGEGWDWAILSTPLDAPLGQKAICFGGRVGGGGGGLHKLYNLSQRHCFKKENTKTAACMYKRYTCKCKVLSYLLSCLRSFTVI